MNQGTIAERVGHVLEGIRTAAAARDRDPASVQLVGVTKGAPPELVAEAHAAGLRVFGENRIQEARQKIPLCPSNTHWHLIGHLQSNKVKIAVQLFDFIHSVDSIAILQEIEDACAQAGKRMPVCLQVNVSGEASKFGMHPEVLPDALAAADRCSHLEVAGLMTIPPFTEDPERSRAFFQTLAQLRDRCAGEWGVPVPGLSMGMSHDYQVAVEEGATWVRVGTAIFGERRKV